MGRVRIAVLAVGVGVAVWMHAASAQAGPEAGDGQATEDLAQVSGETASGQREPSVADLMLRVERLSLELESLRLGGLQTAPEDETEDTATRWYGFAPSASKVYRIGGGVSLGGYGEMVYENFRAERDDDTPAGPRDRIDYLRHILYVGYKFSDRFLLNSEIEIEHASTGIAGEVSLEFAYIDWLWHPEVNLRGGLLLIPVGIINEIHEPTTFLGANRPQVERHLIPATWRENGAGIFGDVGPIAYRSYVVNGMDAEGFSASGIRGGRQKGSQAKAESFAWVTRVEHTSTPGLNVGGSVYYGESAQGLIAPDPPIGARGEEPESEELDVSLTLVEGHAELRRQGLEVRLLGAMSWIGDTFSLNRTLDLEGRQAVGKRLWGGYAQIGYDVLTLTDSDLSLVPFFRYERLNTQDEVVSEFEADPANDRTILTFGAAFRPIDQIVLKADYQDFENEADTGLDQFNVAIGYIF